MKLRWHDEFEQGYYARVRIPTLGILRCDVDMGYYNVDGVQRNRWRWEVSLYPCEPPHDAVILVSGYVDTWAIAIRKCREHCTKIAKEQEAISGQQAECL